MTVPMFERRDPGIVILFSVLTCGFYLIYWYMKMYEELQLAGGCTPTGNGFGLDLLLTIDQVIQHVTERELETAMQRTHARRGWSGSTGRAAGQSGPGTGAGDQ